MFYKKGDFGSALAGCNLTVGGGHGMMFDAYSASVKSLPGGRSMYLSRGASSDTRARLQKIVLEFFESKL